MSILIKNILLEQEEISIRIEENKIAKIDKSLPEGADIIIDGKDKAVFPGFVNGHTHAGMTLFRGFAEDLPLESWLKEKIWPAEAKHTDETIYWGTKLACLEMIETGTTCANDMYFNHRQVYRAISEMGLRAIISPAFFDFFEPGRTEKAKRMMEENFKFSQSSGSMVRYAIAPHAIYTVSAEL